MIVPSDPLSPLPVELYPLIFQYITKQSDLCNLCIVSRVFRHEAERVLYSVVALPGTYGLIPLWCRTVVERPRLASLVHTLILPTRYGRQMRDEGKVYELQIMLKRALSSLSRLSELYVCYYRPFGISYLWASLFNGHSFRLRVYDNSAELPASEGDWTPFISEQPGIRHWNFTSHRIHLPGSDMLPLLTSACIHVSQFHILAHRPIRDLQVEGVKHLGQLHVNLKLLGDTLRTLCLRFIEYGRHAYGVPTLLVRMLSDVVPRLEFLELESDLFTCNQPDASIKADFLSALSGLPHLTTLMIRMEIPYCFPWVSTRAGDAGALALATALMEASPSLRHVAFELKDALGKFAWYRSGSNSQGGISVVFEGCDIDILHQDSWKYL